MTDKMPEKILKPCPFCGAEAVIDELQSLHKFNVHCSQDNQDGFCPVRPELISYYDKKEAAINHWNTRHLTSTVTAELDLANKACEAVTEVLKEKLAQWATEKKNLERRITERNTALAKYQARLDADAAKLEAAEKRIKELEDTK